jgi:hypothetical protein
MEKRTGAEGKEKRCLRNHEQDRVSSLFTPLSLTLLQVKKCHPFLKSLIWHNLGDYRGFYWSRC